MACLSKLFGWLAEQMAVDQNPCRGVKAAVSPARDRVLSEEEVRWFWAACGILAEEPHILRRSPRWYGCFWSPASGAAKLPAWCASELSADGATLTIPGKRTKNRKPHIVPLSRLARELLAGVEKIDGRAGYVFSTTGTTPLSGFSKIKRRLDARMLALAREAAAEAGRDPAEAEFPPWRLHDLRRTAATGLQQLGVKLEVTEAVLNHVSGSRAGIVAVYQVHEYADEKRAALDAWATRLQQIIAGGPAGQTNVVALRAAGG